MKRLLSHCFITLLATLLAVALSRSAQSQFVVNEVLANEPGDTVVLEWIELFNDQATTVPNLSFYSLEVLRGSISDTIALSGSIGAGEYMVICRDSLRFEAHFGDNSGVWGDSDTELYRLRQSTFMLPNSTGEVQLKLLGSLVSTFPWSSDAGDGVSWERRSTAGSSIATSLDPTGSTPGRMNSRSPQNIDVAIEDVLVGSDSGVTYVTFLISNVGLTLVDDPVMQVAFFDSLQPDSLGALIATERPGPIDTGQTVFYATVYALPGVYQQLIARLEPDDRPENDVFPFTAPGDAYPPILINEFMANPQGALASEWVELLNVSREPVNVQGWLIGDSVGLSQISDIPLELQPDDYLVLAQDEFLFTGFYSEFNGVVVEVSPWRSLNNSGDLVRLRDVFGIDADAFVFESAFDSNHTWGRGPGEDDRHRWGRSEEVGGSPGVENTVRYSNEGQSDIEVTIEPQIFSPNDDGYEDSTYIRIVAPEATGYSLKLYDSDGRLVRTFEDESPDVASTYAWDGRDAGGGRLPIGIYIVLFEAEGVQSVKHTVVVAR